MYERSPLNLRGAHLSTKALGLIIIFTAVFSFVPRSSASGMAISASASGIYRYTFSVDEDGFTNVVVDYTSSVSGSSWVFVPKFSNWSKTFSGNIISESIVETKDVADMDYYFYQAFNFSYSGPFTIEIQFNMSAGALIIEPRGIFFSPQIGFKEGESGQAEVYLPSDYSIKSDKALALGLKNYQGSVSPSLHSVSFEFPLSENLIRLQVEFSTKNPTPDLIPSTKGIFTFTAVRRYESYGSEILNFSNSVYSNLTELFNVNLTSVNATFFIPDFDEFLSIGGYVPLEKTGITTTFEKVGDIYINVFFIRAERGIIEIIALHELVHHFLLQAGISPSNLLWFHEGMAQYASIEIVDKLGYEGAATERERLEKAASQLIIHTVPLQDWSPEDQPTNIGAYYAASYYVVSRLAENYGGLNYYADFFKTIGGTRIEDNDILAYHLSLAANASVVQPLRNWGFNLADIYISSILIEEAKNAIYGLNPLFQPFKFIAEQFYELGLISLEKGDIEIGNLCLRIAIFLAKWAPLLAFITVAAISAAIIYFFQRKALPKPEVPTTFEPVS